MADDLGKLADGAETITLDSSKEKLAGSPNDATNKIKQKTDETVSSAETVCPSTMAPASVNKFSVWYLGSASMHRLCVQTVQPWVMAEIKRRRNGIREVTLEIGTDGIMRAKGRSPSGQETGEIILEHHLQGLSRFARLHQDTRCFSYLTRMQLHCDYVCHVYLATTENTILDLFTFIRDTTKQLQPSLNIMGEGTEPIQNVKITFEVKYLGRAKASCKKLSSEAMDALAERLMSRDGEQVMRQQAEQQRRQRHASGTSIKSLPASLDEVVSITENNLGAQLDRLRRGANASSSHVTNSQYDSADSSADDLASSSDVSSTEYILDDEVGLQQQQQPHQQPDHHHLAYRHHSLQAVHLETAKQPHSQRINARFDSTESTGNLCSSEDVFPDTTVEPLAGRGSQAMLLQIGEEVISLISLDQKLIVLDRKFKDIASVSQGYHKKDMFGIIVRDPEGPLVVYVLNCFSETVVNEIMSTLQVAFTSAYQKSKSSNQVCTMCPLHQFHRLTQEIGKLRPQNAHDILVKRIQQLSEQDIAELCTRVKLLLPQNEGASTYEESVEVMMIGLRQLCELKQREHTHLSEGARPSKNDLNLMDDRHKFVFFEGLRQKAKKSLVSSFENLLRARKKEDAKDAFRQRSWTTDSDGTSWIVAHGSSVTSTPDASPLTSPVKKHYSHDFPSPPASPEFRRRSSTLDSIPDTSETVTSLVRQRLRDVNHNTTKHGNSPMKTMYLLATSPQFPDSSSSSPQISPQDESAVGNNSQTPGSWRKAIFDRVCTPSHQSLGASAGTDVPDGQTKKTSSEIRALWKKAMLETLLLIRMEKENSNIRARQEEECLDRKLDYKELTPCLRDITKVWEDLLNLMASGKLESMQPNTLLDYVKKGVPRNMRGLIWNFLSEQQKLHGYIEPDNAGMSHLSYEDLLKQLTTHQHAILIDLGRTFPGHPYFAKALGPGQLELFNLLKAYSLLDAEVGYCQGISFIAGILLMHMEELNAFALIRHLLVGLGLRKQYCPSMMALQVKLYQLMRLIHDHYKDLYEHFEKYEIAPALYATPWFLTLFASQYPLGFVARVFDMIFVQGPDVIFKVALMLLGSHRELILQCDTFEGVVDFLKTTLPEMVQVQMERVINQAFDLDISKQLQAYEVEYHVFSEEMLFSPRPALTVNTANTHHHLLTLQQTVRKLRQQNLELVEKLQRAHSQQHSLQMAAHEHRVNEDKLKSRVMSLELERAALLSTVAKLKSLVPNHELEMLQMSSSTSNSPSLTRKLDQSDDGLIVQPQKGQENLSAESSSAACQLTLSLDSLNKILSDGGPVLSSVVTESSYSSDETVSPVDAGKDGQDSST